MSGAEQRPLGHDGHHGPHRPRRALRRLRRGGGAALLRRGGLQGALLTRGPGQHHGTLPGGGIFVSAPGPVGRQASSKAGRLKVSHGN